MDAAKFVLNIIVGFIPDLAIAWSYMKLTDGGSQEFWSALIILQCVYLFLWLKRTVWAWLLFWLYNRRSMARTLEKFFKENNFPRPQMFTKDLDDYLPEIINNETEPTEVRIKASFEYGTLNGLKIGQRYAAVMMLTIASKRALDRYARYAPERTLVEMGFQ